MHTTYSFQKSENISFSSSPRSRQRKLLLKSSPILRRKRRIFSTIGSSRPCSISNQAKKATILRPRPTFKHFKGHSSHLRRRDVPTERLTARLASSRWHIWLASAGEISPPDDRKKYYQDLAKEDMKRQRVAMDECYRKQESAKKRSPARAGW